MYATSHLAWRSTHQGAQKYATMYLKCAFSTLQVPYAWELLGWCVSEKWSIYICYISSQLLKHTKNCLKVCYNCAKLLYYTMSVGLNLTYEGF